MGLFENARKVAEAVQARKRQDEADERETLARRKAEEDAEKTRLYEAELSGYVDQFLDAGIREGFKSYVMSQAEQGKIADDWVVKFASRGHSEGGFLAGIDLRTATHLEKPVIEAIIQSVNAEIAPEGYAIAHSGYMDLSAQKVSTDNRRVTVGAVIFKIAQVAQD